MTTQTITSSSVKPLRTKLQKSYPSTNQDNSNSSYPPTNTDLSIAESITAHSRSLGHRDVHGNLHSTKLGATLANKSGGQIASGRLREKFHHSREGSGSWSVGERESVKDHTGNLSGNGGGRSSLELPFGGSDKGLLRKRGIGGLIEDDELGGVEHDPEHNAFRVATPIHFQASSRRSSISASSSVSSAESSPSSSSRALPLNGTIYVTTSSYKPPKRPTHKRRESSNTANNLLQVPGYAARNSLNLNSGPGTSGYGGSSASSNLVVPIAKKTVGRDLRWEGIVPTAPTYKPKGVTDRSLGDQLWKNRTSTSTKPVPPPLLKVESSSGPKIGSVKSSLIESISRANSKDPNIYVSKRRSSTYDSFVSSPASGSGGSKPSWGGTSGSLRVGSRIDESDVEAAHRASFDLASEERAESRNSKKGSRIGTRKNTSEILVGGVGVLEKRGLILDETESEEEGEKIGMGADKDTYDYGGDGDSDDSLPPAEIENEFTPKASQTNGNGKGKDRWDLGDEEEEEVEEGEKKRRSSSRGTSGRKTMRGGGSRKVSGNVPVGEDWGGGGGGEEREREKERERSSRPVGFNEQWKEGTYGLKRSWNGLTLGAKFEVFRAKKKLERAFRGQ